MSVPLRYSHISGATASDIARSLEAAIREGRLEPGSPLPTVRALAARLTVSPATVAGAFRSLRLRGLLTAERRRGTRVSPRPPLLLRPVAPIPEHLRNLADGNPDPNLLPRVRLGPQPRPGLYGEPPNLPRLLELARRQFEADGIPAQQLAVLGGAMDALERTLQSHLRPGDRVAVEDPCYHSVLDLLAALGLTPVPVEMDEFGMRPEPLAGVLAGGVSACILTPRAQNPSGAALDAGRARALRQTLERAPQLLAIEDDHAGPVAGVPAHTVCSGQRENWAVVRSVSKSLGPDLRVALLAGDATTIARVQGRQALGAGWVSHLLQAAVAELLAAPTVTRQVSAAARTYAERRSALLGALTRRQIPAQGRSGLNVWIPVAEEAGVVAALAEKGWAVRAGERYRLKSPPAVRITTATLKPAEAERLAADLARLLAPRSAVPSA